MRVTRKGLKEASSRITGLVATVVFAACLGMGLPFVKAILAAIVLSLPFVFAETLLDLPEMVRSWRANWRLHAGLMAVVLSTIGIWRFYASASELTKEGRIHSAITFSLGFTVLTVVFTAIAFNKGWYRRAEI